MNPEVISFSFNVPSSALPNMEMSFFLCALCLLIENIKSSGGSCIAGSTNLVHVCQGSTYYNKSRFTLDFSTFKNSSQNICRCFFIAQAPGTFILSPVVTPTFGCGTQISLRKNSFQINGGYSECQNNPFPNVRFDTDDTITMDIVNTSSTSRNAGYCYVATYSVNVTLTCTTGITFPVTKHTTMMSRTTASMDATYNKTSLEQNTTRMAFPDVTLSRIPREKKKEPTNFEISIVIPAGVAGILVIAFITVIVVLKKRTRQQHSKTDNEERKETQNVVEAVNREVEIKNNIMCGSSDGILDNVLYFSNDQVDDDNISRTSDGL